MSASLQASARAAYRDLWRASRFTFAGDPPILTAFREKMRTDAAAWKAAPDAESANANFQAARDVAAFLRRNVVQMRKTEQLDAEGNEVYHVAMNEYSELGDNNANRYAKKEVPDMAEVRRQRRAAKSACQAAAEAAKAQATPISTAENPGTEVDDSPSGGDAKKRTLNYSQLKRAAKERAVPELKENDLEEKFVRGSGPGGQSINKTQNNVQLLHVPTGIRVTCQETRSLEQNRKIARKILLDKLDAIANPGLSKSEMKRAKQQERERRRRKKAKKKQAQLAGEDDEASL